MPEQPTMPDTEHTRQLRIAADHFDRFTAALVRAGYRNDLSTAATAELIEAAVEHMDPDYADDDEATANAAEGIARALYAMRWKLALFPMDNGDNP